jgi:hypothetical protein
MAPSPLKIPELEMVFTTRRVTHHTDETCHMKPTAGNKFHANSFSLPDTLETPCWFSLHYVMKHGEYFVTCSSRSSATFNSLWTCPRLPVHLSRFFHKVCNLHDHTAIVLFIFIEVRIHISIVILLLFLFLLLFLSLLLFLILLSFRLLFLFVFPLFL